MHFIAAMNQRNNLSVFKDILNTCTICINNSTEIEIQAIQSKKII